MKKITTIMAVVAGLALNSLANDLKWGLESFTVSDNGGSLVVTSKTDPLAGAFIQLIWVGANGIIDPFLYAGSGVSGDDEVLGISYSYGGTGIGVKDGKFKLVNAGLTTDSSVYIRVYNEANENYNDGLAAAITGGVVSHYWESLTHGFTFDSIGVDDQWEFATSAVQTTTAVPEPATFLLFGIGGMGAFILRRNKLKAQQEEADA